MTCQTCFWVILQQLQGLTHQSAWASKPPLAQQALSRPSPCSMKDCKRHCVQDLLKLEPLLTILGFPILARQLQHTAWRTMEGGAFKRLLESWGVFYYVGRLTAVRSMFCQRVVPQSSSDEGEAGDAVGPWSPCIPCQLIIENPAVKKRAQRVAESDIRTAASNTNWRYMGDQQKRALTDAMSQNTAAAKKARFTPDIVCKHARLRIPVS